MGKTNRIRALLANRLEEEFEISRKISYQVVDTVFAEVLKEIDRDLRTRSRSEVSGLGFFKKISLDQLDRRDFMSTRILFSPASVSTQYKRY